MKHLLSLLLMVALITFTGFAGQKGEEQKSTNTNPEIIVGFEKYTPKLATEFNAAVNSLQGIREIGACEKMNIIYFSYDPAIYKTPNEAYEAIEKATKRFNPLLKIGSSSTEVERACNSL